ncbi:DM13 domain-containing protein [Flammeovirgaceae bacterium SG7u.111]|nr:DM13 domain-containing protein [Flammeovirgaceae bacterium SG7u.132]WPO35535.1 DM13 domain-containing protein [Flammeovirgaceae bacterium SG7u.111]
MPKLSVIWFLLLLLSGCIGTDILEIEMMDPEIKITSNIMSIKVGEEAQFKAVFFDEVGDMTTTGFTWTSTDESIISIDNNGLASALKEGKVIIEATKGGISDAINVEAGSETIEVLTQRTGTFTGLNNYSVEGTFGITENRQLVFQENFKADSGPGLYVYLSNNATSVQGGVELGMLKSSNGLQEYDLPSGIEANTYDHVIIHCKPFNVPFGTGKFE